MEEVLHIEDYDWWCEELGSLRDIKYEFVMGKFKNSAGVDKEKVVAKLDTKIADIENKITQIENLKQHVS